MRLVLTIIFSIVFLISCSASQDSPHLERGENAFYPNEIYECSEPEGFVCNTGFADDTIHLVEFYDEEDLLEIAHFSEERVAFVRGMSQHKESPQFFLGDISQMHVDAYQSIQALVFNDSTKTITFPHLDPSKSYVLFTILEDTQEKVYKKYIWILK